ncbi:MAG: AAA family ATPase [Phormidesmis sp.]
MGVDLMPFADNWAYLKTELSWLDRLLMLSIAKQRKETKAINKVAKTTADQVSSYWWKGVISVSKPAYDDCRVPAATLARKPVGYQQQLESRIQLSAKDEVVLALPSLRHYLNLSLFEKNLLLMAIAPEINRRYGRLYHYLQTGKDCATASDLPTLDLALRLLCRNDLERRRARASLTAAGSLIEKRILRYVSTCPSTRLNSYLQLSDNWVDYLLAEQPDQHMLFAQLASPAEPVLALPEPTAATRAVKITQPEVPWDQLILPAPLLTQLRTLGQQTSAGLRTRYSGVLSGSEPAPIGKGQMVLLVGAAGTGKTTAAGAIATSLRQPLCILDLKQIYPEHWLEVLESLDSTRYPALLVKSAWVWFGRKDALPSAQLSQWLQQRQASPGITLLSTGYLHTVKAKWRRQLDAILTLPLPHRAARTTLWRQAFAGISGSAEIDWIELAKQVRLSGGEIQAVAEDALAIAQSKNAKTITLNHIQQALNQRQK